MKEIAICFKVFLLCLLLAFSSADVLAKEVKHLSTNDGLTNGYVTDFEKDSLGYMWIATFNGLNRYSGYEFKHYSLNDYTEIHDNRVEQIINYRGDLLVIGRGGVVLQYRYHSNIFFELLNTRKHVFVSADILNDSLMVIGLEQGLLLFDFKNRSEPQQFYNEIEFNRKILVANGSVYSATSQGLKRFEYNKTTKQLIHKEDILPEKDIIDFEIDSQNRFWIGTEAQGLFVVSEQNTRQVQLYDAKKKHFTVRAIGFNHSNEAVIGIDRLGMFVIDDEFNILNRFSHDPDNPYSISQNSIHEIYVDEYNVVWLAAGELGIDLFYSKPNPFKNIYHIRNEENSIGNNSVRSIYQDDDNAIWFGTEDGISILNPDGNWTNYNKSMELSSIPVLTITKYQGNEILGTYGEGLKKLNKHSGLVEDAIPKQEQTLELIFATHAEDNGLWIGGNDGPVTHYKNGKVISSYTIGRAKCIVKGHQDQLFIGSVGGVFEINRRNNSMTNLFSDPPLDTPVDNVYSLHFNKENNCLWIGNDLGLHCFDFDSKKLETYHPKTEIELGTVFSILPGAGKEYWLGTSKGLFRYKPAVGSFRKYTKEDGLVSTEFGFGASAKFNDEALAFGGPKGAVIFNPDEIPEDTINSNIYISDFTVNGNAADRSVVPMSINYLQDITLDYFQNSLSFTFEVLEFHGSRRNTFKWQLIGYDSEPNISKTNRTATYSKLEPGDYTLVIETIDTDGNTGNQKYELGIEIKNPFWLRWWAWLIYAMLIGSLLYSMLETVRIREKQKHSDDKIRFFTNVAHDICTPLSLIKLSAEKMAEKQEGDVHSTRLILRNTNNLNEYVTQLLDFQKAERKELVLKVTEVNLKQFFEKVVVDFKPLLEEKSIDLVVNVPELSAWFDKKKMKRVFNNLISNAIKYSEEGSKITIEADSDDIAGLVFIKVIDNGIGIPEEQQKLIFSRFKRGKNVLHGESTGTGLGLMLSKKIVELHRGNITVKSKVNLGSTFTVNLQKGTDHYSREEIHVNIDSIEEESLSPLSFNSEKLILVVEDNDDLRSTISSELSKHYRVITAKNGEEGMMMAMDKNPDLVITDIMMPVMGGKELCHVLKSDFKTSHIPVIIITALSGEDTKMDSIQVGADAFVEKPFSIELLKATTNNLLRSRDMLGKVMEKTKEVEEIKASPDEDFLSRAVDIIKESISDPDFNIDVLCEKLGASRSNLFRKLKGLTGLSPSELILKIKLNHAAELLKSDKKQRIADVAYLSGIHDPKYFSTLFKKHFGKTPKEYMENEHSV